MNMACGCEGALNESTHLMILKSRLIQYHAGFLSFSVELCWMIYRQNFGGGSIPDSLTIPGAPRRHLT